MVLEVNDYFVIQRGRETSPALHNIETPIGTISVAAQHDRTYDGGVFKALVIEHTLVAAEVVFPPMVKGHTMSIDTTGMEIMRVSKEFVDALKTGEHQIIASQQGNSPFANLIGHIQNNQEKS